ncbi:MAG: DNA repair protein RecN [Candidatus Promineifilaceae bacterium]
MLAELHIWNFAIIDELKVEFHKGLNVLTGETGAGKSIILDAMALVLGERADVTMVRSGCEEARVEAVFQPSPEFQAKLAPLLHSEGLEGDDPGLLILARELRTNGRNICRLNGRAVNLSLLREVGEALVDIHGQGEHLSLLKPRSHLPLLDAYAGLEEERRTFSRSVADLRRVRRELSELQRNERELAQRVDLLRYQVEEIEAAKPAEDEETELRDERTRLANVEHLMEYAAAALSVLNGAVEETPSAVDLLGMAEKAVSQLSRLDPSRSSLLDRLEGLSFQLTEIVGELSDYQETLEFNPKRLEYVEERIELINRLKRKYGDNIPAILAYRDAARKELANIEHSGERIQQLLAEESQLLHELGQVAWLLSQKRQEAAGKLAAQVEDELSDLHMAGARFQVHFAHRADDQGLYADDRRLAFDETGIDEIEFLISANPGEALKPLAKVASGGETSRLMLALKTALARVDATPTLIFDEIDQGIGGRVGDVVGRKLWGLTTPASHQVVVVTHLPQLAGYADGHYHVSKQEADGRTTTRIANLDDRGRVMELAAMIGTEGVHATGSAESILAQAAAVKLST